MKLNTKELDALAKLIERGIAHQQIAVGVTDFSTTDLCGTIGHDESVEIVVRPSALKWLWVRNAGAQGGLAKAAKAKKRNRAR